MSPIRCGFRWLLGLLPLLPACHSFMPQLKPERDIPDLHELGVAYRALDERRFTQRSDATVDAPLSILIYERGPTDASRVVVQIHGVLADHRAWRYVTADLAQDLGVWTVDLPGCGRSDHPNPDELSADAYSPTWQAKHVLSALRKQLAERDDSVRLTLLGHSLGGGVILRMLGDLEVRAEFADVLERIDGAVMLAPLDFGLSRTPDDLVAVSQLRDLEVFIGMVTGIVRKEAAEATYAGSVNKRRIPYEEFENFYDILMNVPARHANQAMLENGIPRNPDLSVNWDEARRFTADYHNVDKPCLIIWGEQDTTLPFQSGYHLQAELPNARLAVIEECMHSIQIDDPALCARLTRDFIDAGLDGWDRQTKLPRSPEKKPRALAENEEQSRPYEAPLRTSPSSVSVLSGQQVRESGARYLSDTLRALPGVEVQRVSSTESGVSFRGYADSSTASQGTLGIVDGRQVYNQFLGNVLWDQLAVRMEDVKQIGVIRGPGSFIHGPNAMHGLVDIETNAPLDYDRDAVSVTTHLGSYDSVVAGATVVNRTENTGFKTSVQYDDIAQFGDEPNDTRDLTFFESSFQVRLDGDPDRVLGLAAGASKQRFDLLLPELEVIPTTSFVNQGQELFGRVDYRTGDPDEHTTRVRASWTGFDAESDPLAYYEPFSVDLDTTDVDAQTTWRGDSHRVTVGAGYRNSTFKTFDRDVANGRHSVNQTWVFGHDEYRLTDTLQLTFGLRADFHSTTGSKLSPRAAAVWTFMDHHYLRASAGRGFRNPSLRELWFDMVVDGVPGVPGPITITGNEHLDAESLTSFELGYFGGWGSALDLEPGTLVEIDPAHPTHEFEAGVSVFYNLVDDLIAFQSDPNNPLLVAPVNQNDEEAYGFEVDGRYAMSDALSAFANYSLTVRRDRETGERNLLAPLHKANLGMGYGSGPFRARLWANYYDRTELFGLSIDSYVLVNGSLSYHFPVASLSNGQVFTRFFNLLNDVHREHPQGDDYGMIITAGVQFDW